MRAPLVTGIRPRAWMGFVAASAGSPCCQTSSGPNPWWMDDTDP